MAGGLPVSGVAGLAVGVVLVILDLQVFNFGASGAVALLRLFIVPGLGLGLPAWGTRSRRIGVALVLAAVVSLVVSGIVLRDKVANSKAIGDAPCLALESCRKKSWPLPARSSGVGPLFLSAVPATSMGVFSSIRFVYRPSPEDDDYALGFTSNSFMYSTRGRSTGWTCDD